MYEHHLFRHPLQEICTNSFVPNSAFSGGSYASRMHIITAPNAAGKSVYLKQIGCIVYLALVGCGVPAEHAKIGRIDRILTRLHSSDALEEHLSTFASDLRQVRKLILSS